MEADQAEADQAEAEEVASPVACPARHMLAVAGHCRLSLKVFAGTAGLAEARSIVGVEAERRGRRSWGCSLAVAVGDSFAVAGGLRSRSVGKMSSSKVVRSIGSWE